MNLSQYIRERLQRKSILLMTHAIAGYPSLKDNWTMLEMMQQAGVDLVELQLPFTEPTADGPVFVKANQEALKNGMRRNDYFEFMKKAGKAFDFPILMMSYYNPVFVMGHLPFCRELRRCMEKVLFYRTCRSRSLEICFNTVRITIFPPSCCVLPPIRRNVSRKLPLLVPVFYIAWPVKGSQAL